MIIISDLYLLSQLKLKSNDTNVFVQPFKAGHLLKHMKFPRVTNVQHLTKTRCLWDVGGGKKCNKQFSRFFLIDYGELIHTCSKAFV